MHKLSKIMWIEAGFGNCRRVMPFALNNNIICSLADDKLFQLDNTKSMYDNLYEICQNEYKYPTVVINEKNLYIDISNKHQPKILNIRLPKLFLFKHRKEYVSTFDINVSTDELKKLSKYLTKEKQLANIKNDRNI